MNYQRLYNLIIEKRKSNYPLGYTERHHINPRAFGGNNKSSNLVFLTAKEHFVCHHLLTAIHKNNKDKYLKMVHAFGCMLYCGEGNKNRYKVSAKLYQKLREDYALALSKNRTGNKNPNFGKIWISNGIISKSILKTEKIPDGFIKGRNKKIKSCSLCGKLISLTRHNKNTTCSNECAREITTSYAGKTSRRLIRCIETGQIYNSILEAEKFFGSAGGSIHRVLRGKVKTYKKCHFEYV